MKNNDKKPVMNSRVQLHAKEYHQKRHIWAWLLGIIAIVAIGAGSYFAYVYFQTKHAVDQTYDPHTQVHLSSGEFDGKHKFAVLLMGTDTGALDRKDKRGNTDTLILAIVNPQEKKYTLMSIPRDTMAQMIGSSDFQVQKINAAYSIGGAPMAMATVSKLINVPVKYYALVNMGGIMKMIHYVNGINVRPNLSFEYGGYVFRKGRLTHLGGSAALAYSRMRYDDPRGDYGRQERQRQVITTLIKKAVSVGSLSNLNSILSAVSGNIKTNLPFAAIQSIALNYRKCADNEKSDYLHGYNAMIDDAAYQIQPTPELQRVSDYTRKQLGLPIEVINNNETYQNQRNSATGFKFGSGKTQKYHIYDDYVEEGDN